MGVVDERDAEVEQSEVRALLMTWDAIGVAGWPEAADEYDCMIHPLLERVRRGADVDALHGWIARERVDHFGLDPDTAADLALADALHHWWWDRQGHR